jgi:hypothetical protein
MFEKSEPAGVFSVDSWQHARRLPAPPTVCQQPRVAGLNAEQSQHSIELDILVDIIDLWLVWVVHLQQAQPVHVANSSSHVSRYA